MSIISLEAEPATKIPAQLLAIVLGPDGKYVKRERRNKILVEINLF